MAESNFITTTETTTTEKFQMSVVRRKLDKFRTKLSDLFFNTKPSVPTIVNNNHNYKNSSIENNKQQQPDDNTLIISSCYYGYTSPMIDQEDMRITVGHSQKKKSHKHKNITSHSSNSSSSGSSSSSSSSACSSSSSMIIEDDSHSSFSNFTSQPQTGELIHSHFPVDHFSDTRHITLPQSLTTGVITLINKRQVSSVTALDYHSFNSQLNSQNSNYDTSSLNTNAEEENPFLNKRLTDQIHFNSDFSQLSSYFEASLDLIDDQDNFFNIDFMTNYIAYILLKNLQVDQVNSTSLKLLPNNEDRNLLTEIAEQIFLESRDEPCGLKGCNISVFIRNNNSLNEDDNSRLVTKFQFGTSRFGAFDIHLILKETDQQIIVKEQQFSSTIATLTRRIFNMNTNNNNNANVTSSSDRFFYLDSNSYHLFKTNLAYE